MYSKTRDADRIETTKTDEVNVGGIEDKLEALTILRGTDKEFEEDLAKLETRVRSKKIKIAFSVLSFTVVEIAILIFSVERMASRMFAFQRLKAGGGGGGEGAEHEERNDEPVQRNM